MKCGPSHKLQPIDELFMMLYRLCCNVLEKDIGVRFGLGSSTVSRTLTSLLGLTFCITSSNMHLRK